MFYYTPLAINFLILYVSLSFNSMEVCDQFQHWHRNIEIIAYGLYRNMYIYSTSQFSLIGKKIQIIPISSTIFSLKGHAEFHINLDLWFVKTIMCSIKTA